MAAMQPSQEKFAELALPEYGHWRIHIRVVLNSIESTNRSSKMMMTDYTSYRKALVALAVLALAPLSFGQNAPPKPFGTYIVYSAAGVFDANIPPLEGDLAAWFHGTVMGRSHSDLQLEHARADQYFLSTFGISPGSAMPFGLDPRNGYTAYFVSGENVPQEGWTVRDGGFMAMIGNDGSGGTTLRGSWGGPTGKWVPAGSFVVFGDYNIRVTGPGKGNGNDKDVRKPIIIHYESAEPIIGNPYQAGILFQCRIFHPQFGTGLAQGISIPKVTVDGRTIANIRNVLTFPGLGFAAQ